MSDTFTRTVQRSFGRRAAHYDDHAQIQRAVAWRLARHCRDLPMPDGPCADLGAGSGLLSLALQVQRPDLKPAQIDLCLELLARNPLAPPQPASWDLNQGLPPELDGASLLLSSFALQWLADPCGQLGHWCRQLRPGGWLALAVPTATSFPQWRQAAEAAAVPWSGLALPVANELLAVAERELQLQQRHLLSFQRPSASPLGFLRSLCDLGAEASRTPPLGPAALRRLLAHWPLENRITWSVLLLIGQRPGTAHAPL
ncbi:MAG: methyltransferase domain-containing protein [Cyanobacteriota bacterium]